MSESSATQQILAKLKTIRDLAPHERPGRIDAANLQVEEVEDLLGDERAIQDLAREILPLLPTVPAIEEEEEDLLPNLDGILTAFLKVHACARDVASATAHAQWPSVTVRILGTMRRAEELTERIMAIKLGDPAELRLQEGSNQNHLRDRDDPATLRELGEAGREAGDLEEEKQQFEESLRMKRSLHRDWDHPDIAATLHELGEAGREAGDLEQEKEQLEASSQHYN